MVKIGDNITDVQKYVKFRISHLRLELQKVPFTIRPTHCDQVRRKLKAKIDELKKLVTILNGDIKKAAKYEWSKTNYLNSKKIAMLKKGE